MRSSRLSSRASAVAIGALALLAFGPGAQAAPPAPPSSFPAAGTIAWPAIGVRARPIQSSKRLKVLRAFRTDYRPRYVLAIGQSTDPSGRLWYRIVLPGRPNGKRGWVLAGGVDVKPARTEVVVRREARRLEVYRDGKRVFSTIVAVGAPGMPTPLGRFYVTAEFRPTDPFYGTWAFETSAYSRLTDWPGGGIVGIHGTSAPWLLGQPVSHGCVRVGNSAANRLHRLIDPGTPIRVLR